MAVKRNVRRMKRRTARRPQVARAKNRMRAKARSGSTGSVSRGKAASRKTPMRRAGSTKAAKSRVRTPSVYKGQFTSPGRVGSRIRRGSGGSQLGGRSPVRRGTGGSNLSKSNLAERRTEFRSRVRAAGRSTR